MKMDTQILQYSLIIECWIGGESMKKKVLAISVLLAVAITCAGITKVFADNSKKSQDDTNDIAHQKGVTWNPERKEYYNSDDFKWDPVKKIYIAIIKNVDTSTIPRIKNNETTQEWLQKNPNPTDSIDKALITLNKVCIEETRANPYLALRSDCPFTKDDPCYDVFLTLKVSDLKRIVTRISNQDVWSYVLQKAFARMTNIQGLELGANDPLVWVNNLKNKVSSIPLKIKNYSVELKNGVSNQTYTSINNDIQSYGIFAVPYIMDEVNNGNDQMIKFLPSLVDKSMMDKPDISKNDLDKKDKSYWLNWFESNKTDISELREMASI